MLPSTTHPGPTSVSSKMYASRRLAPGPIVHRSPTTEAWIEAFSETVVCDPMSVLFPILHVLQGRDGTEWKERNGWIDGWNRTEHGS